MALSIPDGPITSKNGSKLIITESEQSILAEEDQ